MTSKMVYAVMVGDVVASYFDKEITDNNKSGFIMNTIRADIRDYGGKLVELPEKAAMILYAKFEKSEKKRVKKNGK